MAMPRKLQRPDYVVGAGALLIASTLIGSAGIPLAENMNPKNVCLSLLYSHLSLLRVRAQDEKRLKTCLRESSCSFWLAPKTKTSSLMLSACRISRSCSAIMFWKILLAEEVPKLSIR